MQLGMMLNTHVQSGMMLNTHQLGRTLSTHRAARHNVGAVCRGSPELRNTPIAGGCCHVTLLVMAGGRWCVALMAAPCCPCCSRTGRS